MSGEGSILLFAVTFVSVFVVVFNPFGFNDDLLCSEDRLSVLKNDSEGNISIYKACDNESICTDSECHSKYIEGRELDDGSIRYQFDDLRIVAKCNDRLVCIYGTFHNFFETYEKATCIRDRDLVEKYCNETMKVKI